MAFTHRFNESGTYVTVVGRGAVTAQDCIALVGSIIGDPRCRPEQSALIDVRRAVFQSLTKGDIVEVAEHIESVDKQFLGNVAILARASTLFMAELLAVHIRTTRPINIRVFVDSRPALAFCRGAALPLP